MTTRRRGVCFERMPCDWDDTDLEVYFKNRYLPALRSSAKFDDIVGYDGLDTDLYRIILDEETALHHVWFRLAPLFDRDELHVMAVAKRVANGDNWYRDANSILCLRRVLPMMHTMTVSVEQTLFALWLVAVDLFHLADKMLEEDSRLSELGLIRLSDLSWRGKIGELDLNAAHYLREADCRVGRSVCHVAYNAVRITLTDTTGDSPITLTEDGTGLFGHVSRVMGRPDIQDALRRMRESM